MPTSKKEPKTKSKPKKKPKPKPKPTKKKAKKKKPLTPAQKAKRRRGKAKRKRSFATFYGNKVMRDNTSRVRKRKKETTVKERKRSGKDDFTNQRSYYKFFPDELAALEYYKKIKQDEQGNIHCPFCKQHTPFGPVKDRPAMLECQICKRQYSIKKGSIYDKSHLPLHLHYDLLFNLLFFSGPMTVKDASQVLEDCSMKAAHAALTKARLCAFSQKDVVIPEGSIIVIDTMAFLGANVNRKRYAKLKRRQIYLKSVQVLTIKVKGTDIVLYLVIKDLKKKTIFAALRKILPNKCTVICDEHKSFNGIDKIKGKEITLERTNHSAGDHGDGSAESSNSRPKRKAKANGNNFSRKGVQGICNEVAFKANNDSLSINQQFNKALKNTTSKDKQMVVCKSQEKRKSTFVKLMKAWQQLHPGREIRACDIKREGKKLLKLVKTQEALPPKRKTKRPPTLIAQIHRFVKAA